MKVIILLGQKSPPSCADNCKMNMKNLTQRYCARADRIYNLSYRVDTTKSRDAVEYRSIYRQRNFWNIYLCGLQVKYNFWRYRCHRPSCWGSYCGSSQVFVVAVSKEHCLLLNLLLTQNQLQGSINRLVLVISNLSVFFKLRVPGRVMIYWYAIPRDAI